MQSNGKQPVSTGSALDKREASLRLAEMFAHTGTARINAHHIHLRPSLKADRSDELLHRIAASITSHDAAALAAVLAASARNPASYEASVRAAPGHPPTAGRMMIEKATPEVLAGIADALGVVLPPAAALWIDLAQGEGVPLITGWDCRGGGVERCVKLYINASDVWRAAGARLCAAVAPGVTGGAEPPAVVGMNVRADGITELKLYMQSADAVALATRLGAAARALALAARDEGADAGGVLSFDVTGGTLRERAFFVALREPIDRAGWRCVRSLAGYDARTIESLLPFAPAPPRTIGISLSDGAWTLYCKPRDSGRAREALEPTAIFRAGDAEVGVFVEPTEHALRAFCRTERHAVIVRVRHGVLPPLEIESLVDWFVTRLRAAEQDGAHDATSLLNPPAPWRIVDDNEPTGGLREHS